jgi:colicin import membrane protein
MNDDELVWRGGPRGAETCDAAIASLEPELRERLANREAVVRAERAAAADASAKAADEARARAERDAAARAEAKRKETAIMAQSAREIRKYKDLITAGKHGAACDHATIAMMPEAHLALAVERTSAEDFDDLELRCAKPRLRTVPDPLMQLDLEKRIEAAIQKRKERLAARERERADAKKQAATAAPAPPSGRARGGFVPPSMPSGPSHEQRMKQMNDHTYGSGRASGCPFSDKSLCR